MLKMICTSIQRKSASNPCDAPRAMLFSILFARNGPRMPSRRYSMSRRVAPLERHYKEVVAGPQRGKDAGALAVGVAPLTRRARRGQGEAYTPNAAIGSGGRPAGNHGW
jgi:hypothetical protein